MHRCLNKKNFFDWASTFWEILGYRLERCPTVTHSSIAHLTDAHCNLPPLFKPTFAHWDNSSPDYRSHFVERQYLTATIGHPTNAHQDKWPPWQLLTRQLLTDNLSPTIAHQTISHSTVAHQTIGHSTVAHQTIGHSSFVFPHLLWNSGFKFQVSRVEKTVRIYWPFFKLWKMRRCSLHHWT